MEDSGVRIEPRELEIGTSMPLKIEFEKSGLDIALWLNDKIIDECYAFCLTGDVGDEPALLTIEQWRFEDRGDGLGTDVYRDKTVFEIEGGKLASKAILKKIIRGRKAVNSDHE